MRRKDREVTDVRKIQTILDRCKYMRLGFNDDGEVYIVPVNYGYKYENETYTLYFHGAQVGRKAELMKQNPHVGFEMDTNYKLVEGEIACEYSAYFQSIIGNGKITVLTDLEEKREGLRIVMGHNTGKKDWEYETNMLKAVGVFKLEVTALTCKEHTLPI